MKTLIVKYTPRDERSRTKRVLDAFTENLSPACDLEILDLCEDTPQMFVKENLITYYRRDYGGQELSAEEQAHMSDMDRMALRLQGIDALVLATPMFNFSTPAIVKAWLDGVMLKGKTWDMNESGYQGLLAGKKALVIYSSGGVYEGETASYNCLEPLLMADLGLMGFNPITFVAAQGVNLYKDREDEIVGAAREKAAEAAKNWC